MFADNLHGQNTDEFKRMLMPQCNALLWLLPAGCTDEIQHIDAGYGHLLKVQLRKALDKWLMDADHVCGVVGGQYADGIPA